MSQKSEPMSQKSEFKLFRNKVMRVITLILGSLMILYLSVLLMLRAVAPHKTVKIFGFDLYVISYTGSMEPMLQYNDLILIKKYDFNLVEVGDIISFEAELASGEIITITHEVIKVEPATQTTPRSLRTKGINQKYADLTPITVDGANDTSRYIGLYVGKSTALGHLFSYLGSTPGMLATLVNLSLIIAICIYIDRSAEVIALKAEHAEVDSALSAHAKELMREIAALEDKIMEQTVKTEIARLEHELFLEFELDGALADVDCPHAKELIDEIHELQKQIQEETVKQRIAQLEHELYLEFKS